jgi:hypothetical protein
MQCLFELALLLLPALFFRLCTRLDLGARGLDSTCLLVMLRPALVKRGLGLLDCPIAALAGLFYRGLFIQANASRFLFSLMGKCRLAGSFLVNLVRRPPSARAGSMSASRGTADAGQGRVDPERTLTVPQLKMRLLV